MNKSCKKQFILEGITSSQSRKIEFDLAAQFKQGNYRFNREKNTLQVEFRKFENVETDTELIKTIIHKTNPEIEITERSVLATYRKVLILENLDCANCAAKIERIAKRNFDHEFIVVDFTSTRFIIESSDKKLIDNLEREVAEIASSVDAAIRVVKKEDKKRNIDSNLKLDKTRTTYFIIGLVIFLIGFIIKTFMNQMEKYEDSFIQKAIIYVTYVSAYILISGDVLYAAFKNIKSGRIFDEKFLMTLATVTALIVQYYDEAIFIMIFYKVGVLLQQRAVNYSRKSITGLLDIQPQSATVIVEDEYIEMQPIEVVIGDTIIVKPGERIPLDGVVIEGDGEIDNSALTGESLHHEVHEGYKVLSGGISVNGNLKIRVTKLYQDSMIAKILDMVENAGSLKTKTENYITRFARYYTPTIVIIALVLVVILPFITGNLTWEGGFQESIMTALIFLVVSCPCALVISIPLGYFGGIGGASKHGILVKGSNYLEAMTYVKTFVFDKTGTLTTGRFALNEVVSFGEYNEEELLEYAAHAEMNSNHPIARSIINAYGVENINPARIKSQKQISSSGISCVVDHKKILIGKDDFLRNENLEVPEEKIIGSAFYIAIDGVTAGCFIIKDEIKYNAAISIAKLKESGIERTVMLTGDSYDIAEEVANKLGIDEFVSNMDPLGKVNKVTEIKNSTRLNHKLSFVGDGINDAPVLSRADVGIAMGGFGSDAAIQVADIVLMTDDLGKLSTLVKIAKKTKRIVNQNIFMALSIKFLVLILAMLEPILINTFLWPLYYVLIYLALFADVGVSLIAIINSLRAMRIKE
ncbi:MAG: heavy metal translocating P-type ATPase [Bacilli bacterium]|nr:heavy metal translocating P-type ATPase [Bacilli bacterium]